MLISIKQAREMMGNVVSLRTVYRLAEAGRLRVGRVGKRMLVDDESVKELLRASQPAPRKETPSAESRRRANGAWLDYHKRRGFIPDGSKQRNT